MDNNLQLFNNISIDAPYGGKKILWDARFVANNQPKPVILFVHGFKGFKDWGHFNLVANQFAQLGFVYIKLNLSHNGTTPESPIDFVDLEAFSDNNFTIELDDLGTLIDFLHSPDCPLPKDELDLNQLMLLGHSRGGGLTLLKAHEDKRVKAVATWAAIHDLKQRWSPEALDKWKEDGVTHVYNGRTEQYMPMKYQIVEDTFKHYDRFDIPNAVKSMQMPQLIVHGTNDQTLEVDIAHEMASWNAKAELVIVEGADHTFDGKHPFDGEVLPKNTAYILEKTAAFFKNTL